jgi:hypothetical protein
MTPTEEANPPMAEGVEEAEAKDPRINQKSSVTSMVQSQTTPRITAQKRRKPLIEWK